MFDVRGEVPSFDVEGARGGALIRDLGKRLTHKAAAIWEKRVTIWGPKLIVRVSALLATVAALGTAVGILSDGAQVGLLPPVYLFEVWKIWLIVVLATSFYLVLLALGDKVTSDSRKRRAADKRTQRLILEALDEENDARLSAFIDFHTERDPARHAFMLVWRGYEELAFLLQHLLFSIRDEESVALTVLPYEASEGLRYLEGRFTHLAMRRGVFGATYPDYMILDREVIDWALRGEIELPFEPLPDEIAVIARERISPHILGQFDTAEATSMTALPLAYGVNALAWDPKRHAPAQVSQIRRLLREPESLAGLTGFRKIGILDWFLPVMGLFAMIVDSDAPYELDSEEFRELKAHLMQFASAVTEQGGEPMQVEFLAPEKLAERLVLGEIHVAIGAGAWAGSAGLLRTEGDEVPSVSWTLPVDGAVLWCEALARFRDSDRRPVSPLTAGHDRTIYRHFLEEENHRVFLRGRLCAGTSALREVLPQGSSQYVSPDETLTLDPREAIDAGLAQGSIVHRKLPPRRAREGGVSLDEWTRLWDAWKEAFVT